MTFFPDDPTTAKSLDSDPTITKSLVGELLASARKFMRISGIAGVSEKGFLVHPRDPDCELVVILVGVGMTKAYSIPNDRFYRVCIYDTVERNVKWSDQDKDVFDEYRTKIKEYLDSDSVQIHNSMDYMNLKNFVKPLIRTQWPSLAKMVSVQPMTSTAAYQTLAQHLQNKAGEQDGEQDE